MTRKHSFSAALLAAIFTAVSSLALLSCSKEKIQETDSITPAGEEALPGDDGTSSGEPEGRQVILRVGLEETSGDDSVLLEEGDTRISISKKDDGSLHTSWTGTDKLMVGADEGSSEEPYTIREGFTDHAAEFEGTEVSGSEYYIIYPGNWTWNFILSKDYNGVRQNGNNDTRHVDYCAMISGMTQMPSSILLTDRYAQREGLTLRKSSVIKFYLKLPAEVTAPERIDLKAGKVGDQEGSDYIFYTTNSEGNKTNTLSLYLENVSPENQTITAYMAIPWNGFQVAAGQSLTFSVYYTHEGTPKVVSKSITPGASSFGGGQTILYQVNMSKGSSTAENTAGAGSRTTPYLIRNLDDLMAMKSRLLNDETVYFKLMADIDMASVDNWSPLNNNETNGFNRYIDFDGNGHIISNFTCTDQRYASFFGVLCGSCKDLGFVNARVSTSVSSAGIIAAYLGTNSPDNVLKTGTIERCYTGGKVFSSEKTGGLVGIIGNQRDAEHYSSIRNSYSAAMVEGNDNCGGLAGTLNKGGRISGSYFCGVLNANAPYWSGGIAGKADSTADGAEPQIQQCASLTKTCVAPHSGSNSVIYRIAYPNGVNASGNLIWSGTNGNARNSSDSQAAVAIGDIQTLFTTTLGSAEGWSGTLDGGYPLLAWQAERGDYATWAGHGQTYFDGGDGSEESPYILSQPYQLYLIESALKTWSADNDTTYIRLAADIDLSVIDNWVPINQSNANKRVNLNGNNKTLSNLTLSNTVSYAGLFGVLHGKVSALTLKDFSITQAVNHSSGILAGFLANTGAAKARLDHVTIDGGSVTMNGNGTVGSLGGFCGELYATDCSSSATVTQNSNNKEAVNYCSGGLVGATRKEGDGAVFEDCTFSGTLQGYNNCGGILGFTYSTAGAHLKGCTFSGSVNCRARTGNSSLDGNFCGGIAGYHTRGGITGCSATATSSVSGAGNGIGGIVGYYNHSTVSYELSGCTHAGSVTGLNHVGGIVGRFRSTVGSQLSDCHAYYTAEKSISATVSFCGGIAGHFWSLSAPASGTTLSGCSSSATLSVTTNYAGGIIGYVSEDSTNGHSILSLDDCSSTGSISAGSNSAGGLIGGMRAKKLTMTRCSSDATVSTSDQYAGGLIGYLSGQYMDTPKNAADMSLAGCHFTGSVTAGNNCGGGIAGQAYQWVGTMDGCTTSGSVQARNYAGGIVGQTTSGSNLQLTACSHSTGNVSYDSTYGSYEENVVNGIGGLVGQLDSDGTVERCRVESCTVTGTHALGGLVGHHASGTLAVSESWFDGTVRATGTGNTRAAGGILGKNYTSTSSYATTITDCYSRGTVTGSGQVLGGIVGEAMPGCSVAYCISDCTLSVPRCAGGIIGRACNAGWTHSDATYDGYTAKVKADHCICWSSSITSTIAPANSGSSGAVIGFTHKGNWMYCSYYNPNMAFTGINEGNKLVSQNGGKGYNTDITGSTAPMVPGTTAGTSVSGSYTYVMPYHGGTVATSGRSAITVAKAIGFADRTSAGDGTKIWELFGGGYNPGLLMPELARNRSHEEQDGSISDMGVNSISEEGEAF